MPFHAYLGTDSEGCFPILSARPLPWRQLRDADDNFLSSFQRIENALEEYAVIMTPDGA